MGERGPISQKSEPEGSRETAEEWLRAMRVVLRVWEERLYIEGATCQPPPTLQHLLAIRETVERMIGMVCGKREGRA